MERPWEEVEVLRAAVEAAPLAIFSIQRSTMRIVDANEAACRSFGCSRVEIRGAEIARMVTFPSPGVLAAKFDAAIEHGPGSAVMFACHRASDGSRTPVQWLLRAVPTPEGPVLVVIARGEARNPCELASSIHHVTDTALLSEPPSVPAEDVDRLTGLADRRRLEIRLTAAMEDANRRPDHRFAIFFIDLDGFKAINDAYGHLAGDRLLAQIANRLSECFRAGDLLARYGGDEFVVLLNNIQSREDAQRVAERVQSRMQRPWDIAGNQVSVGASIGIALSWLGYQKAEQILHDADRAMYQAKSHGKGRYQIFTPRSHSDASARAGQG